jgi:hypothetical protein
MFIRRTTRNRKTGEAYFTYRLVQAVHVGKAVSQRTLLNLGTHLAAGAIEAWETGRVRSVVMVVVAPAATAGTTGLQQQSKRKSVDQNWRALVDSNHRQTA